MDGHRLIFDEPEYAATLAHLGRVVEDSGLPFPVLARPIPGTPFEDALGPWPYASAPHADTLADAVEHLRAEGFVTLTATIRPDAHPDVLAAGALVWSSRR